MKHLSTRILWRNMRLLYYGNPNALLHYINVVLSTVEAAQPILSSEKAKTPLPRWLPDKPKYHKWWMLVRHTLKWHLLLILPKMGLALGFMEILYYSYPRMPFSNAYIYQDYNVSFAFPVLYPQWETIVISLAVVCLFAILETALLAAMAITTRRLQHLLQKAMFLCLKRVILIFIFVGIGIVVFTPVESHFVPYYYYCRPTPVYENGEPVYEDYEHRIYVIKIQNEWCNLKRLLDTTYLSLMTFYDQGTLLRANIMRPWGQVTYADLGRTWTNSDRNVWDNRLFVARQIVAGVVGLLLYAGTTWVVLWFVEDEVVQE